MKSSGNYAILMFQSDLEFLKTVRNSQLPMELRECSITDKVSEVFIFENAYLWVTLCKSFIFVYLCSHIYSLFLKVPSKLKNLLYSCFSILQ